MRSDLQREMYAGLDEVTTTRRDFIQQAFRMLPPLEKPRVLDIGCGRGGPTLELAKLTAGEVIGIDVDAEALQALTARAAEQGLAERIRVRQLSMSAMDFAEGSFDIIWAEASIHAIGFEKGLDTWRRFLLPRGFLVIHEMAWLRPDPPTELAVYWSHVFPDIRTLPEYVATIPRHGYRVVGSFALPEDYWWDHYFAPLSRRIGTLREKYAGDRAARGILRSEEQQVALHAKYRGWYGSAYLVMRKESLPPDRAPQ